MSHTTDKLKEAVDELLHAAYKYDDKPHKLYWRIIDLATMTGHEDFEEISRLMNKAAGSE